MNHNPSGKMLVHGLGSGALSSNDLQRRAQEIAEINGRSAPIDSDLAEARAELGGDALPPTTGDDVEGAGLLTHDPSEPLARTGHQTPSMEEADGQKDVERLVSEGVEEASHDQMLAARRQQRRTDKS